MTQSIRNIQRLAREHFWGLLLLVVLLAVSSITVRAWKAKHPGAMTVLESQAMDMTVMKPPVGAVPVATEVVHTGSFQATVTYTGSVAPLQEQVIFPRVEGILQGLLAYNGDRIVQGQLIATVDSPDLQSKVAEAAAGAAAATNDISTAQYNVARLTAERSAAQGEVQAAISEAARAKAMVTAAERTVAQRQKDLSAAQANLEYWRPELARMKQLLDGGMIALQQYQSEKAQAGNAEAEVGNKQAMVEEARANVEAAKADAQNKELMISVAKQRADAAAAALTGSTQEVRQKAALAQQARAMTTTAMTISDYRNIRAPFAGTLTKRYVSPGQYVSPTTAIASVVQIDKVRLQANVADTHLSGIRVGAPVTARFSKDPTLVLHAVVTSVSPLADQDSRTATVEAIVPNYDHRLLPGDAVTMEIAASGESDVITVPAAAIVQKDGMSAIWIAQTKAGTGKTLYTCTMHPQIIRDKPGLCPICSMKLVPMKSGGNKQARLVMVRTGATDGDRIQILSGLQDGAEVITQGNTYLKEGDTVFATTWTANGPVSLPPAAGMENMPGMDKKPAAKQSSSSDMANMLGMEKPAPAVKSKAADMKDMPGMEDPTPKMDSQNADLKAMTPAKPVLTTGQPVSAAKGQKVYVCPMHPHEMSHDPNALCRLCGMHLVEKM
jgi:multidrug efflux pump subunit AcrA (membrane-fusion protein)